MRTFVAADLHLTSHTPPRVAQDFAELLRRCAGEHLVLAGDFFDLPTEAPDKERRDVVAQILSRTPPVQEALGRHLEQGGRLSLCSGNHDAAVGHAGFVGELAALLKLSPAARSRLTTSPWFLRQGDLHIEHGHFYDPDNAPEHPLVMGQDPLGVHFSAKFVNPTGAHRYHHANDSTPLRLFLSAFSWYGPRAPHVIYKYFTTAFSALARSGPFYSSDEERHTGQKQHPDFASDQEIPLAELEALFELGAPSTLRSFRNTFARMYLDRVAATLLLASGLGCFHSGGRILGRTFLGLGGSLMALSWAHGHNRYRGSVVEQLGSAAQQICATSEAALVIFGHTHRAEIGESYANTGSFSFPEAGAGRPFLEVVRAFGKPQAKQHRLSSA
jgi:UDP-2,3-diacylglucosamine pyrophosphatase LpxH